MNPFMPLRKGKGFFIVVLYIQASFRQDHFKKLFEILP
jgi:hypothetical protein